MEVVDDSGSVVGGVQFSFNNFEFEFSHIFWEIVVIADMGISEPGGGFGGRVGTLEGCLEIFDKIWEGSKQGGIQGILGADSGPAFGCSFSHEGKGISNFLVIRGVNIFVDEEISPD